MMIKMRVKKFKTEYFQENEGIWVRIKDKWVSVTVHFWDYLFNNRSLVKVGENRWELVS